jgi:sporulation protein YlmC with PRC-barrel domain
MKRSALLVVLGLLVSASVCAQTENLRASQLMNMEVRGLSGVVVGEIKDVVIDRQSGGFTYAIVALSKVPGKSGRLFAVPWEAFTASADRKSLVIGVSNDVIANAQGFDPSRWPDMTDPAWVARTSAAYGIRRVDGTVRDEPRVIGSRETIVRSPRAGRAGAAIVSGTVQSLLPGLVSEAVVTTDYGDVDVLLGPHTHLDDQRLTFDQNVNVAVRGYPAIYQDRPVLVATEAMTRPGRWERVRNEDLTPAWRDPYPLAYQVRDITGTVEFSSSGSATVLTEGEGYRNVFIAPSNYFESRHWRLRRFRPITVTGYDDPTTGEFVAISVEHEDQSWRVRHDDFTPYWRDEAAPYWRDNAPSAYYR